MKSLLFFVFLACLCSCSEPTKPETMLTKDYYISLSDYTRTEPGYFSVIKDCPLITSEIMKNGSVSVFYQPINADYYLQLPQTIESSGYIYNWNYSYKIGKIQFFTKTNFYQDNSAPIGSVGYFHVIIFSRG